jgi:hypothetical protein
MGEQATRFFVVTAGQVEIEPPLWPGREPLEAGGLLQTPVERHDLAGRWRSGPDEGGRQLQRIRGPNRVNTQEPTSVGANVLARKHFYP